MANDEGEATATATTTPTVTQGTEEKKNDNPRGFSDAFIDKGMPTPADMHKLTAGDERTIFREVEAIRKAREKAKNQQGGEAQMNGDGAREAPSATGIMHPQAHEPHMNGVAYAIPSAPGDTHEAAAFLQGLITERGWDTNRYQVRAEPERLLIEVKGLKADSSIFGNAATHIVNGMPMPLRRQYDAEVAPSIVAEIAGRQQRDIIQIQGEAIRKKVRGELEEAFGGGLILKDREERGSDPFAKPMIIKGNIPDAYRQMLIEKQVKGNQAEETKLAKRLTEGSLPQAEAERLVEKLTKGNPPPAEPPEDPKGLVVKLTQGNLPEGEAEVLAASVMRHDAEMLVEKLLSSNLPQVTPANQLDGASTATLNSLTNALTSEHVVAGGRHAAGRVKDPVQTEFSNQPDGTVTATVSVEAAHLTHHEIRDEKRAKSAPRAARMEVHGEHGMLDMLRVQLGIPNMKSAHDGQGRLAFAFSGADRAVKRDGGGIEMVPIEQDDLLRIVHENLKFAGGSGKPPVEIEVSVQRDVEASFTFQDKDTGQWKRGTKQSDFGHGTITLNEVPIGYRPEDVKVKATPRARPSPAGASPQPGGP